MRACIFPGRGDGGGRFCEVLFETCAKALARLMETVFAGGSIRERCRLQRLWATDGSDILGCVHAASNHGYVSADDRGGG